MAQCGTAVYWPWRPSTDSTGSGRVSPGAASESDRAPHASRGNSRPPKHRLITRCGIGGDSQAAKELSIPYTVLNYIPMGMVVDNTTDVRRGKLALYESWGFPEVWVEVPERVFAEPPGRPAPRLDDSSAGERPLSHRIKQPRLSELDGPGDPPSAERTRGVVRHHGRVAQGGTHARCGSRNRPGRRPVAARGAPAEPRRGPRRGPCRGPRRGPCRGPRRGPDGGLVETQRDAVLQVLKLRGLPVSAAFPRRLAEFKAVSTATLVQAALDCRDEADFLRLLRQQQH